MLSVNMDDVMQVVSNIQNYLIAFGVVVVVALVAMFAAKKLPKAKKKMVRAQSGVAILLALVIVVNLICIGPMSTMLDLVSGEGSISEETSAIVREALEYVVSSGSGKNGRVAGYRIGGKTGTAQTGQFTPEGTERCNLWFAGFWPAEKPRYTIVVLQDGAVHTAYSGATIFAQVCNALEAAG